MVIQSTGYGPPSNKQDDGEREFELFRDNLELILEHTDDILSCSEYFFCLPSFAFCSWPYVSGDGPLWLGYLLLGWQHRILIGGCPKCGDGVLVTAFGGSPLSGSNSWGGICPICKRKRSGRWSNGIIEKMGFVSDLRKAYPDRIAEWEDYDGFVFSWGGSGLRPARKKRLVWKQVASPVTLELLVAELRSGDIRKGVAPNVSLLRNEMQVKFDAGQNTLRVQD